MSVVSTSPTLQSTSAQSTLVVTFNRELSSAEQSAFSATLVVKDSNVSLTTTNYTLSGGIVSYLNGNTVSQVGWYTFSGETLSITLDTAKILVSFTIDED